MTGSSPPPPPLLLVEQHASLPDGAQEQLPRLAQQCGLDLYTVRQRLTGRGLACLAEAPRERLEPIVPLLEALGLRSWIVQPTPPRFAPQRVRSVELAGDGLRFATAGEPLAAGHEDRVLAVLADLSGTLVQRNLKKLAVQTTYLGAGTPLDPEEIYQSVLRGRPLLDLYRLDESGAIGQGVRLFPGRFDPNGLGGHKSLSAAGNLDAILRLLRERVGELFLHSDFGLVELPGCRPQPLADGQAPDQSHLAPITRFGWLLADWHAVRGRTPAPVTPERLAAAALLGIPAAVVAGGGSPLGLEELAAELRADEATPPPEKAPPGRTLPPPPELKPLSRPWLSRRSLQIVFGVVAGSLAAVGGGGELVKTALHYGLKSGAVPGLFALLFGGWGLSSLRLKRHMENLPTSKARSVAMGMVEVHGRARRQYALVSPMTHQACVFYRLRRFRRDGDDHAWQEYSTTDCGPVPFELEDDTGRLTIDPAGARIAPRHRQEGFPGQGSLLFTGGGSTDATEKWVEEIIPDGASIYVSGFARSAGPATPSLAERTRQSLRELKQDPQRMRRFDRDGDGRVGGDEWQQARETVEQEVLERSLEERLEAAPPATRVVIGHPRQRLLPFVIAETPSELHLTRRQGLLSGGLLGLGFVLAVVALVQLLRFFAVSG